MGLKVSERMFCEWAGILYNHETAAILQQTKKEPLVTQLFPTSCYLRGWQCELDYDRNLKIGQIPLIPSPHSKEKDDGPSEPSRQYPVHSIFKLRRTPCRWRLPLWDFCLFFGLLSGKTYTHLSNKKSQARQCLAFENYIDSNEILRLARGVGSTSSAKPFC